VIVDLHCHSTCSDGSLSPKKLLELAESSKVEIFSITDHDIVDAYRVIKHCKTPIKLISGIEFSTVWNKIGVHIVGLNIDIDSAKLQHAIDYQRQARDQRAQTISQRLQKLGLNKAYETLKVQNPTQQLGRPDFAKLLIEQGIAKDWNQAFKKYLGAGKIGDVKSNWLDFEHIIHTIRQAGGIAVLAHPLYYQLTNSKLKRLLQDFVESGGEGLEVLNGYQNPDKTRYLCLLCKEFKLKASIGSDFHHPKQWMKLGCDSAQLSSIENVWSQF
jgi:predicted metal-dependent phosphoesterase TrpH